jgi:hypothetical protein
VSASIDYSSFTVAITRLETASQDLQKQLVDNLHREASGLDAHINASAFTKVQRRAASTVRVTKDTMGITVQAGGGGGLGGELFAGGEFGGRKSKKKGYATRSPRGKAYTVVRRTTMQFLPHLGNEGYFFWPTIRAFLPQLYKEQKATVEAVLGGKR